MNNTKSLSQSEKLELAKKMLNSNFREIMTICEESEGAIKVCDQPWFWYEKLKRDFPEHEYSKKEYNESKNYGNMYFKASIPLDQSILFIMFMTFNYSDLINYCKTHKEAMMVCTNPDFWWSKAEKDFGKEVVSDPILLVLKKDWKSRYEVLHFKKWLEMVQKRKYTLIKMNMLTILDLSNKELKELPETFGQGLTNLRELYLKSNKLKELPENFGQGLTNLRELFLENNKLKELPKNFGQGLTNLLKLNLSGNNLSKLPENFGQHFTNIEYLNLGFNDLKELPKNFGQDLTNLIELYMYKNKLKELPKNFGQGLTNLQVLWLSHNELTELPKKWKEDLKILN